MKPEAKETIPQARMTEIKNSLAEVCGQRDATTTWWGICQKVTAEIIKATPSVTPQEVRERARRLRQRWPGYPITLQGIVNHWGSLGAPAIPPQPKGPISPSASGLTPLAETYAREA